MIKRMLIMLILVGAVLGGLFGFKTFVNGKIQEAMAGMANIMGGANQKMKNQNYQ